MNKKQMMAKIDAALTRFRFIDRENMTFNELVFILNRFVGGSTFINLTNTGDGDFAFGSADSYWPIRFRALRVERFEIVEDDEDGESWSPIVVVHTEGVSR